MRDGYGNSSLFHADYLRSRPLNASLATCPWSGLGLVVSLCFGLDEPLAINIFCSIKWTNLMCCHGYAIWLYANRWLDWLDGTAGGWRGWLWGGGCYQRWQDIQNKIYDRRALATSRLGEKLRRNSNNKMKSTLRNKRNDNVAKWSYLAQQ